MSGAGLDPRAAALGVVGDVEIELEAVVDRAVLTEMLESIRAMFGVAVRVYSNAGALVAQASSEIALCGLVNELGGTQKACGALVGRVKATVPGATGEESHACFTGLEYRIVALEHDGRRVGRAVLGPFAPEALSGPPDALVATEPRTDLSRALPLYDRIPRVAAETLGSITRHLKTTLELVIFASHKAWITSQLHLYSVAESYRALEEKTRRLEQALVKLREADRLRSAFLATVSHELRTPLTSILGYSEMLSEGMAGALSDDQRELVQIINAKGDQLLALITGLLDLSKMESGTMSLRKGEVRVESLLVDVGTTLTPVALKKGVVLAVNAQAGDDAAVTGDAERLRQVFLNLVENAIKFTPSGGTVSLSLAVEAAADEESDDDGSILLAPVHRDVVVSVSDTGIGIPEHERERVFEAFYQVDSSSTREHGGTGLGLSIVKRIVEAHGGSVRVRANDAAASGAVFVVRLPTAQAARVLPSRVPPPVHEAR